MTEYFDPAAVRRRYELLDDAALLRIAGSSTMEYISEAVALAREELEKRGIASGEPVVVEKGFASASEPEERNKSLHDALKVLCFLLTPLPGLLIACWQFFSGRNKAAKDALIWTLCGLIFWTSVKMLFRGG